MERAGNRLPDPVTLFFIGAMMVLAGSELAVRLGWTVQHPTENRPLTAVSLLSQDGLRWVWLNLVLHDRLDRRDDGGRLGGNGVVRGAALLAAADRGWGWASAPS